jgi:hypothetical protein
VNVQYLGLGDLLVIASAVLGIQAEVLAKASNLVHALPDGNKRTALLAMIDFASSEWPPAPSARTLSFAG